MSDGAFQPIALNHSSFIAKIIISSGPSTNDGRHIPNSDIPERNPPNFVPENAAAAKPSASPAASATASAHAPSSSETAAFSARISPTLHPPYLNDGPSSPRARFPRNDAYCRTSGLFSP